MWVPCGHYGLDVVTKLLIPQKFVYAKHLKQMKNQIVPTTIWKKIVHNLKKALCGAQLLCCCAWFVLALTKPIQRTTPKEQISIVVLQQ
jgi:hypothetical protein